MRYARIRPLVKNMKPNRKSLPIIVTALLALGLVGCGSNPITNCITQAQGMDLLTSMYPGIVECTGPTTVQTYLVPGCSGNQIVNDEAIPATRLCAFHHPEAACGAPPPGSTLTCNVFGDLVGTIKGADGCGAKCFVAGSVSVRDTGISCTAPTPPPGPNGQPTEMQACVKEEDRYPGEPVGSPE